jgi:hypothetical protein
MVLTIEKKLIIQLLPILEKQLIVLDAISLVLLAMGHSDSLLSRQQIAKNVTIKMDIIIL